MSVPMDWKPERAIQAKVRDLQKNKQKWWWKNNNKRQRHHSSRESSGRMHFVLVYKWRFLPKCLIDGFYPDWWWLLPVLWSMATSAKIWVVTPPVFKLTVCPPISGWINGLLSLRRVDWWVVTSSVVWWWSFYLLGGMINGLLPL